MGTIKPLKPIDLYRYCEPDNFSFKTTADLEDIGKVLGQPRAVEAVRFGIGIKQHGYNIFALGPEGTGKHTILSKNFTEQAKTKSIPHDWCYVHNFAQAYKPNAIKLPAGLGRKFCEEMENLVEELQTVIPAAFESDEYRARRQIIEDEFKELQESAFEVIQEQAQEKHVMVLRTPGGLMFAPTREGQVLPPEEFQKLPQEERSKFEANIETLQQRMQVALQKFPNWQKDMRKKLRELNQEITNYAVSGLIDEMRTFFADYEEISVYLEEVQKDVVENARGFIEEDDGGSAKDLDPTGGMGMTRGQGKAVLLRRYQVNLLIDHSHSEMAPVIFEDNPTYQNLIGRVDQQARLGALVSDFNMIKPGALLQANGGYLIVDARKLLTHPYAWEGLKRALQSRQIRIESPGQMLNLVSTISLEPEPIPIDVKVALLGDRMLYYLLSQHDPDFTELFKVGADFAERMDRDPETLNDYAKLIATLARKYDLYPLHRDAVARVVEQSSRMISDSEKLSIMMSAIADLLREADYWAQEAGAKVIRASHVQQAIDAQIYRSDRIKEQMQEEVIRETMLIDTSGAKIGQINGLSVLQLGGFAFGRPSRITARVRIGKGEVIDIEREVELGGPLHSKGILILSSYLGARYASDQPLSLTASLVFEQSYGGVDGDSASSAELYALLSALGEIPILQNFAVTGSVNQHGQVQAIGGVNEKIEGFFDLCAARGLIGDQGVLIPKSNVKHLMLREDIVKAVKDQVFHIYPIESIDQGIEILTGLPAGNEREDGSYPPDTVNSLVQAKLTNFARTQKSKADSDKENGT